jgi:hypothetical protein
MTSKVGLLKVPSVCSWRIANECPSTVHGEDIICQKCVLWRKYCTTEYSSNYAAGIKLSEHCRYYGIRSHQRQHVLTDHIWRYSPCHWPCSSTRVQLPYMPTSDIFMSTDVSLDTRTVLRAVSNVAYRILWNYCTWRRTNLQSEK